MRLEDFQKQNRGPYSFDRWQWKDRIPTKLGNLVVELSIHDDHPAPPDVKMSDLADELAKFAVANDEMLMDLIYGHYRYAEKEGWLDFWKVPAGLGRDNVLSQVESIELCVYRDREERPMFGAAIHVNPNWDQEHKLDLRYKKGKIVEVNDEPFALRNGILYPK